MLISWPAVLGVHVSPFIELPSLILARNMAADIQVGIARPVLEPFVAASSGVNERNISGEEVVHQRCECGLLSVELAPCALLFGHALHGFAGPLGERPAFCPMA